MKQLSMLGILVGVLIMVFALTSSAANIPIKNFSFESPLLVQGQWVENIPDWTIEAIEGPPSFPSDAGVWYPKVGNIYTPGQADASFVNKIPEGNQVAYSNWLDISQTLDATIIEGYRYTLTVYVGGSDALEAGKPYAVILAGTSPGSPISTLTSSGVKYNEENTWREQTLSYISPIGDLNAGKNLTIRLINKDGVQVNFDKVTLDGTLSVYCTGFLPPFNKQLTLKKNDNRAIPIKMVLRDINGDIVSDADIEAPVVNVFLDNGPLPTDDGYNPDLLPPGLSDDGNTFRYDPDNQIWILNLGTKQFTALGTYTVRVKVGGYYLDCTGTFVRQ